jgi:SAM-dependent methyltransferase
MTDVIKLSPNVPETGFPDSWFELANEGHFWCKARQRCFISMLKDCHIDLAAPSTCLEIGCGNGQVRRMLEAATAWEISGADLCYTALLQNNTTRGKTYHYDIHDRRADMADAYDHMILFDVLEHIDQPITFLQSTLHHLKPGGLLFINVPALESLRSPYDTAAGHVRRYDTAMLASEIAQVDATVVESRYWGFGMVPMLLARKWQLGDGKHLTTDAIIQSGFKPPSPLVNAALNAYAIADHALFRRPIMGTSLIAVIRKNS